MPKYDPDALTTPEEDAWRERWSEKINRFSQDRRLRKHGFTIHARPRSGPVTWWHRYCGVVTEAVALEYCACEEQDQKKAG